MDAWQQHQVKNFRNVHNIMEKDPTITQGIQGNLCVTSRRKDPPITQGIQGNLCVTLTELFLEQQHKRAKLESYHLVNNTW